MITRENGIIIPKESLKKEFFNDKKHGEFYYKRCTEDVNLIDESPDIIFERGEDFKEILNEKIIEEDIEKTINFLNNTEYLNLVNIHPTSKEVLKVLHKDNRMERGIISTNYSNLNLCIGQVETANFNEVLSKEIFNLINKLGLSSYSTIMKNYSGYLWENMQTYKENILDTIEWGMNVMNTDNIHPNIILLPIEVYNKLFGSLNKKVDVLKKTTKYIAEMEVWIQPYNEDIILYKNEYLNEEFNIKKLKGCLLFSPFSLFGKLKNNKIKQKSIYDGIVPDKYEKNNFTEKNKYIHLYNLRDIGYFTKCNFLTLYK